jgi:hypothetical protein
VNSAIAVWLAFRALRWACWLGLLIYSVAFVMDRDSHINSFGQLLHTSEAAFFGFGLGALFAGFLELAMRERTGLARPSFGRLIPPPASAANPGSR